MTYLKEEDVDKFKDFIASYVGIELFGEDEFTLDKAEVSDWETQACEEEDGRDDLYSWINIDFEFSSSSHNEDSWWRITKGCPRAFYAEDFEKFYERTKQNDSN